MNAKFPISKFHKPKNNSKELFEDCIRKDYCVIARLKLYNVRLKDELTPVPYISESNCTALPKDYITDNGRILKSEYVELAVTEVDLKIIFNQY